MTHYRMLDRAPSVVITSNRNELKLYQGNQVFLNDGDNFELRFFNPLPEKIGVEINFNGMKKGDGYLVLNPGQDLILDRFLDEQRKMLFETYVINGNNKEAVEAIEQNGVISFNFYKEYHTSYNSNWNKEVKINYDFPPKPIRYTPSTTNIYNNNYFYGTGSTYTTGIQGACGPAGCAGYSGVSGSGGAAGISGSGGNFNTTFTNTFTTNSMMPHSTYLNSTLDSSISFSEYVCENTINPIDYNQYLADSGFDITNKNSRIYEPLETGRIEKGEVSKQTLKGVNLQFSPTPFHSVTYKLMPNSAMNKTIGEVRQYCPECGYRLRKQSWSFCPKCGEKL